MASRTTDLIWIAAGLALGAYADNTEYQRCRAVKRQSPGTLMLPCRRGYYYTALIGGSVAIASLIARR